MSPPPFAPRAVRGGALLAGGLAALLVALLLAPPFVPPPARVGVEVFFSWLCHRLPERSFHVGGVALGACHRCTGIYAGLLAGATLFPLLVRADAGLYRRAGAVLAGALVPLAADWALGALGVAANTAGSRFATGAVFGAAAGYYVARGMAGLFPAPLRASGPDVASSRAPAA